MSAAENSMLRQLRVRISDERPSRVAFSVAVPGAESALVEITGGMLSVEVRRAAQAQSQRWALHTPAFATVGALAAAVRRSPGYVVVAEASMDAEHASADLALLEGISEVGAKGKAATLYHRQFSDASLLSIIREAATLHNPNYSNGRVPPGEHPLVVLKAAARAYQVLAAKAAQSADMRENAESLRLLARDTERQYTEEVTRLARVLVKPKMDESRIGSGDVIVGHITRIDPRTGLYMPTQGAPIGDPPVLLDVPVEHCFDYAIQLRWRQNREDNFGWYEVWRDTVETVERCAAGSTDGQRRLPDEGTSQQVFGRSHNASLLDGGRTNGFVDDGLEPDTTYYYRVFLINRNGEALAGNVVAARTKATRARMGELSPSSGTGGTEFSLTGTGFHAGMQLTIGGKLAELEVVDDTEATGTMPVMLNPAAVGALLDVVLTSTNGLTDVRRKAWRYE